MKRRSVARLRAAVLVMCCLTVTTPAWAGLQSQRLGAYLQGVNRNGCLTDCGGKCTSFCAVLNTCTGKFVGSARACVQNQSCRAQCYKNVNELTDCNVRVNCSLYTVQRSGAACYVASGCIVENGEYENPS